METLENLCREYQELNGTHYDILDSAPTALEFSRMVNINRPAVFRRAFTPKALPALTTWTDQYLLEKLADSLISIAVTPNGQADSLVKGANGTIYFTEPHTQKMTMGGFFDTLKNAKSRGDGSEVYCLQSQDGNLFSQNSFLGESDLTEFEPLRTDVLKEVPWASEALGRHPDAVNLWIGDAQSTTSVHTDPYENIYTIIRGSKHFTLFPPTEGWCLRERFYPYAIYSRPSPISPLQLTPVPSHPQVAWSSIPDPTQPLLPSRPITITLQQGETLYLPAGWWHHVRQTGGTDGKCIAVNWWYDMEMRGMNWVWLSHLRRLNQSIKEDPFQWLADALI